MNISVIGTGYVGLVTGACFAEFGLKVTCVDKDKKKIQELSQAKIPIFEPGLEEIVRRNMATGFLRFTSDVNETIQNSLATFIAVGTPSRADGSADLSYVDEVAEAIAHNLTGYKVIVTKSTVPVGTGERIRATIEKVLEKKMSGSTAAGSLRMRRSNGGRRPVVRRRFQPRVPPRGERGGGLPAPGPHRDWSR